MDSGTKAALRAQDSFITQAKIKAFEDGGFSETMSFEDFMGLADSFTGSKHWDAFARGDFGTDPEAIAEKAKRVTMGDDALFVGEEIDKAKSRYDDIETPELGEFDPTLFDVGDALELEQGTFGSAGDSRFSNNADLQFATDHFRNIVQGGEDAAANAEWMKRKRQAEQAARAQREASAAALDVRGLGGSGTELLADMAGQQAMTEAQFMGGLGAAAMEQGRRDQAAGAVYDMGANTAGAEDAWSQWSTARDDYNTMQNVNVANAANVANFGRANQVADNNVVAQNQAQQYNLALPQQGFQNEMMLAGAENGLNLAMGTAGQNAYQFGENLDFNQQQLDFQMDAAEPNAWDYITGGLGALAGLGTGAGDVIGSVKK